jgi:SET domain-containing protein 6|tara:strand:+ start:945 stop:2282 length:1338 start_codon:yes stop_codon:yes gene_type:complete
VDGTSTSVNQNVFHYAVYAKTKLSHGQVVVSSIPKQACLSARTSACAKALQAEQLGGGLALNVAIMYERLLGKKSKWYGYFAVLPNKGERTLPMFWHAEALSSLDGTELQKHVTNDIQALREDYDEHVLQGLCVNHPEHFSKELYSKSFELYLEAASLAASRAFYVGAIAGEALVPIADLFNHRTDNETVRVFGADDEVEEEEGEGQEDEEEGEEDEEEEGEEVEEKGGEEDEDSEDSEAEDEETDVKEVDAYDVPVSGALEIRVCQPTGPGEEMFNTFGVQNNASLLHKYGFCETRNGHTTVGLDVALVEQALGKKKVRAAAKSFGMDLDEEVYFEIEPDGTVETSLLALIARVHRASADDDDPAQENEKVRDSIRAVLNARLGEYEEEKQDETICGAVLKPPPAGGGVVGVDAASVLRASEIDLLRRALRALDTRKRKYKYKL